MPAKPRLAVVKFASCDGCQLSLLSLEDELLRLAGKIEVAYFLEATSRIEPGPYDVVLVEGSITTADDATRIQQLRRAAKYLITIGACATAGGIQALKNWADSEEYLRAVYARPDYIRTLATSTAIADHVAVDFELRGCPINKHQLLEVLRSLLAGCQPRTPTYSVCVECKRRGSVCVMVAHGTPCLGPVTQAGCGAICPAYDRGCYGCFGPSDQPNLEPLTDHLRSIGMTPEQVVNSLRGFSGYAGEFRRESERLVESIGTIATGVGAAALVPDAADSSGEWGDGQPGGDPK